MKLKSLWKTIPFDTNYTIIYEGENLFVKEEEGRKTTYSFVFYEHAIVQSVSVSEHGRLQIIARRELGQ